MISKKLKSNHINQAIDYIDKNGVPENRNSTKYDLIIHNKKYPPKYVVSIAHIFVINRELKPSEFDAVNAKKFLVENGFNVKSKKSVDLIDVNRVGSFVRLDDEYGKSSDFYEGSIKQVQVNVYERNSEARKKCLEHHGYRCKVCDFDFEKVYGVIGKDYIHVHHIVDLASIGKEYKVDPVNDLIPVCPNCHAMLHIQKPIALSVEKLKRLITIT